MQQRCNNCGSPLQPGSPACTTCGAPVTSAGAGSYDPTILASTLPASAYGSQPYGPPPSPYGAPPSSPYGAPPPTPGFGAPPAQPGFGTSPAYSPPPGFGAAPQGPFYGAPQPGFGGPPVFTPAAPPPQKSRALWYILGSGVLAVIVIVGIVFFVSRGNSNSTANTAATPTTSAGVPTAPVPPTGRDITNVEIGTGDSNGNLINQTTTFTTSDNLVIIFTVTAHDDSEEVELHITDQSDGQEVYSDSLNPNAGTSTQEFSVIPGSTGSFTVELQFNGNTEYTTTITVTS